MSYEQDELDYLSPDFDPASVTVPRLRSILLAHSINYPSSAKKPQLVQLFNEHVAPQAKKILSARSRTKRSTRGIVDVPSSQASTVDEEEIAPPPPPPATKTRSSRRTTRAPEEDSDATLLAPTPAKARRTTSKHARAEEPVPEERPAPPRSRKSKTLAVKAGQDNDEPWRQRQEADSPFTSDNPFQSGSSPPAESRGNDDRRRKSSLGPVKEKRKSSSSRRKTDGAKAVQQDGDAKPSKPTFEMPLSRFRKEKHAEPEELDDNAVPAGEEFTPEETLELVRDRARSGELNVVPPRRPKKQASSSLAKIGTLSTLFAMLGGLGFVWRQEKLEVGYCGIGREPSKELGGVQIPDWAKVLQPQCEPCPPHAFCYQNLDTSCSSDFILKPHPLSLGGLVPLPPTCEPDSEKAQRVVTVADRAVEELRERNAKFECGEPMEKKGKPPASPAIPEDELKESMSTQRRKKMSQEDFEELWKGAIGEILQRDEVVSDVEGNREPGRRNLRSTSLARQSFTCAIRQSIRDTLVRYLWPIIGLFLFFGSGMYVRYSITYNRETEETAKRLASFALDRLHTQAALHAHDSSAYPENFISMGHLRDDVLREEFSASRRTKLWEKVQTKVEGNLNVRPMVREGRHGDVSRVWEWTGAVGAIEDGSSRPSSGSRRQSSRYIFGPGDGSSPMSELSTMPSAVKKEEPEMAERRKWEESRPIY